MSDRPVRWAWLVPAVAAAALTVATVAILRVVVDGETADALPRTPASHPASAGPAPSAPASASAQAGDEDGAGGPGNRKFLHLRGDGLDMVGFGASQHDVVATLTDVLGPPDEESDEPCDGQPQHLSHWARWADLSVRFDAETFVGYLEGVHFPPGPTAIGLSTTRGLTPGDGLSEARRLYGELQVRADAPTPGQGSSDLFTIKDPAGTPKMFGLVESAASGRQVATIFAGDLC